MSASLTQTSSVMDRQLSLSHKSKKS